jgi:hypothetical protein
MNDSEMQIAIAEACGWKVHPKDRFIVIPPNAPHSVQPIHTLPDYLNDLNAMHEAEKTLPDNLFVQYANKIPPCATARQRAEVFLKTLNLWKP